MNICLSIYRVFDFLSCRTMPDIDNNEYYNKNYNEKDYNEKIER